MTIKEIIDTYESIIERMEIIAAANLEPLIGPIHADEANRRLLLAFPDMSFYVTPPRWLYDHSTKTFSSAAWEVSVHNGMGAFGIESWKGKTLADAVNAALASLQPPPASPVADIQAALTPIGF